MTDTRYIRRFAELGNQDVALVGGKNASLGEMYCTLSPHGVRVPNGFATTATAYYDFLDHNALRDRIEQALASLDVDDVTALAATGARIREWISHAELPERLATEIAAAYEELAAEYGANPDVAVRSSATAEDLPTASFAGQQETYLNIRSAKHLLATCRQVYASLFTNRAIAYRVHQGFRHMDVALSIGVQKMVRSDLGAAGVMFTIDTETGFADVVLITAAYGLGENVVQGTVNPDEFYVFKPTLAAGFRPIIQRQLGEKAIKMIYTHDPLAGVSTRNVAVRREERNRFALTDDEVLELARYAVTIEQHYSRLAGRATPMDIEWARDGQTGELFIVQARPETVKSQADSRFQEIHTLHARGPVLTRGKSVGQKIGAGPARVILEAAQMTDLQPGEVLVTDITDPDWEPVMKIAAAIVTNRGGRTCHAAIVARELGIPAIVGCGDATEVIATGQDVTVSCAEGDVGYIYEGIQAYTTETLDIADLPRPRTDIMVNLGNPGQAFETARLPCDGVGLARLEFIINDTIRVHPRAILEYDSLDRETRRSIDRLCAGYPDRRRFYVDRLAEGIGMIAAAFYPKPVIVRTSDFKSNEYAALIGGATFEPHEENPMIGLRGAARYFSKQFAECFAMECEALRQVRETMGLDNVIVLIPFVRSVAEARAVLDLMAQHGLERGRNGLKIYMMCEIPSNALLAGQFLELFDGYSIGSNDLTQLTLGVDRDSNLVTGHDERDAAVMLLMEVAIEACRERDKYIGICGQAPSDFPEITERLVRLGISSISLNPDSVIRMTTLAAEVERDLAQPSARAG
ncbi:MAG: pyruvate water dikinase [Gammaproteobacteria bacterium]|nr:MAG: pyruvate water dikinase [Gammaproteobacteria bacterium]TND07385.1 MAG: pyruvate, water dikinase [Gammaproteobacteria bacterium]